MNTPNRRYWTERAAELEQAIQNEATPTVENIKRAYEQAIRNINADMNKVVRGLSRASGIPEAEAKKLLNKAQSREQYKDLVRLYDETADERMRGDIALKINRQAYGARMTRLEALKEKVYIHLMHAQNKEREQHKALHADTLQRSYYSNIHNIAKGFDIGINFSVLSEKTIEKTLSAKWRGSNYSARIWNNNRPFIEKVQQTITDGITAGHSISRMSEQLLDYVAVENKGQRYIVERLVRSETAHFMAEGQLQSYKEIGVEKYQFVAAFSERTCDICGGLDGEIFDVSQAIAGENYPPIHANCRCTTVIAGFDPATRIARDPLTGKNYKVDGGMTFSEWKNSLSGEQKSAFNLHVRQIKNKSADKKQYEKYISVIGKENMPKTFDAFQNLKYNNISEWAETKLLYADKNLQNKIRNTYNLEILEGKQGKHILGHNNYIEGRSYLTVSMQEAQELVNRYAGTGHIDRDKNGKWKHTETILHNSVIGVDIDNRTGQKFDTDMFKIHYSKSGTHIVPKRK